MIQYPRVAALKTLEMFRQHLTELGVEIPLDESVIAGPAAPLAQPLNFTGHALPDFRIGNRFAVLPMEGWDGELDGAPSDLVRRRWTHFALSGAKLIWGGEAAAVREDGRANPRQLVICERHLSAFSELRSLLVATHEQHFGTSSDLLVGLQLTHSGRFARPHDKNRLEPRIVYRHPYLDSRFGSPGDAAVLSDADIGQLVDDFVTAAQRAQRAGFSFVDIKHCHGYFGHELLSALTRPGAYGGSLENRLKFLRDVVTGIRQTCPGLEVGVRLSVFDSRPYQTGPELSGVPVSAEQDRYPYAFGADATGLAPDLTQAVTALRAISKLGIRLICVTLGSPYYNPHLLRPAMFPPSDGYFPPEDPLVGVARHIKLTAELKKQLPEVIFVGSGYSYLQEWLPNVAQAVVRQGMADFVGVGRMVLAYPEFPADVLAGRTLVRKRLCRSFSDCTTGPRNGMISGCFPLDPFYKAMPEAGAVYALRPKQVDPAG